MTEVEVAELVATISVTWPRPEMKEGTQRAYERFLVDLDRGAALEGVGRLASTQKFLPSIAEIREAATAATLGPVRSGVEAWGDVLEARASFGFKQKSEGAWTPAEAPILTPAFTDPVVAQAVERSGGWGAFVAPTSFDRDTFVKLYDGLARRAREEQVTGRALPEPPRGMLLTGRKGAMSQSHMADAAAYLLGGIGRGGGRPT